MEKIVSFISLPSLTCIREVLVDGEDNTEAKLRALSTSTAFLCEKYFEGKVQLTVRDAPPPLASGASTLEVN